MKFEFSIQPHNTGMVLEASPDDYFDGQPKIAQLLFDTILANSSTDHVAVAAALLFGDYVGHEFFLDSPISRLAAEAVQSYLKGRRITIQNVSDIARTPWPSAGCLQVQLLKELPEFETTPRGQVHGHQLFLADSGLFNGALGSPHQSIVATNVHVFSQLNDVHYTRILIALGILFSRDLHMRTIEVPQGQLSVAEVQEITALVRAVDLNVKFV